MNDDELNQRLQKYGAHWRDAQPSAPPAKAPRNATRRWIPPVAAAAAAALVAVGISFTVTTSRHHHAQPTTDNRTVDLAGTVPWADLIAPPGYLPDEIPVPRRADARPCSAADVTARFNGGDGAGGHEQHTVEFRNVSTTTCLLTGYPQTVLATDPGKLSVKGQRGSFFPDPGSANMRPGGTTRLGLETDTYCAGRPEGAGPLVVYHHFDIRLPTGGHSTVVSSDGLDVRCGLYLTHFYIEPTLVQQPNRLAGLTARLDLPTAVRAGSTLTYVADLTNTTNHTIRLPRFCLAYIEVLYPESSPAPAATFDKRTHISVHPVPPTALVKQPYGLNCASVRTMTPKMTVRYEMRMTVPGDALAGRARVQWSLDGLDLPSANGEITISRDQK